MGVLMGGVVRSSATHGPIWAANVCITQTFHCYGTDGNGLWNDLSDGGAYAYSGVNVTAAASGFNPKSVNVTDTAYYPDLGIYGLWVIIELDPAPPPPTCFTAETRVSLADGSERRIDAIAIGDLVLGRDGRVNQVVAIEQPPLGSRWLYAINGSDFFVTAEHPLLTTDGWKAIDPDATAAENPALAMSESIGRLAIGDTLLTLRNVAVPALAGGISPGEQVEVVLAPEPVASLVGVPESPETPLYNLVLDGDHTYFANGVLAHNKGSTY